MTKLELWEQAHFTDIYDSVECCLCKKEANWYINIKKETYYGFGEPDENLYVCKKCWLEKE